MIRYGSNGAPECRSVHYDGVVRGEDPSAGAHLAPDDVVYLPRAVAAESYRWFDGHFLQYVPMNWGFSYPISPGRVTVLPSGVATASH